jgi:hypothetical protein
MTRISGPLPGNFLSLPPSSETSPAGLYALPELSAGEKVEAAILSSLGSGRYLIQLKNAVLPARSDLVFLEGERISVVVDRLQPEILFRIAGRSAPAAGGMPAILTGMRAGTSSLFRLFADAAGLLSLPGTPAFSGSSGSGKTDSLLSLIRTLILSREALRDPLFIRNFVFHLGLLHEKTVRGGTASGKKAASGAPAGDSLKGLLLRAAADPRTLEALWGEGPDGKRTGQDTIRQFVDNGLGAIETEQWLNLVLQETESRYLLSLPFLFQGGVRMQDLVIRFDRRGRETEKGERSFQVTLYLDLDVLGKAVADVTMKADRVGCAIRFEEKSGCDLLAPHLEELAERLKASGYGLQFLTCVADPKAREDRETFLRERYFYGDGGVDCIA